MTEPDIQTKMDNLNNWSESVVEDKRKLLDEIDKKKEKLVIILKEYNLPHKDDDFFLEMMNITYKNKLYIYNLDTGEWRKAGQVREDWYRSKSPRQFVEDYIINSPYN